MKVAIDIRHIVGGVGTGGQRVLDHLIRAIYEYDSSVVLQPYNAMTGRFWKTRAGRLMAPLWADVVFKNLILPFWSQRYATEVLLHALPPISFTLRRVPQICYILDVPLKSEERSLASIIYNDLYIKYSCKKADMILTISKSTAQQIETCYNVPKDKIRVVYLCQDIDYIRRIAASHPPEGCNGYFIGILSRLNWRKNPAAYLQTFRCLPKSVRERYPLVLVGAVNTLQDLRPFVPSEVIDDLAGTVHSIGRVSDAKLIGLLKGAKALLFPSNHEGFGLPVIEAVACGVPAVISDIPVFQELFSEVAHLYAPDDCQGMAERLLSILNDGTGALRDEVVQTFLNRYSFKAHAARMHDVLSTFIIKR